MPRVQQGASTAAESFLYAKYWAYKLAVAEWEAGVKPTYTHEWEAYLGAADMYMMVYGADEYDKIRAKVESDWRPDWEENITALVALHVESWTKAHGEPPKVPYIVAALNKNKGAK